MDDFIDENLSQIRSSSPIKSGAIDNAIGGRLRWQSMRRLQELFEDFNRLAQLKMQILTYDGKIREIPQDDIVAEVVYLKSLSPETKWAVDGLLMDCLPFIPSLMKQYTGVA